LEIARVKGGFLNSPAIIIKIELGVNPFGEKKEMGQKTWKQPEKRSDLAKS
jgi:hypothetical protein